MEIRKILFTTDFSEGSAHAMKYAIGMANKFGAKLHLLHTVHNIFIYPGLHISVGRKGLDRALLGSTAERVVRNAQCPVLTVRMPM